MLEQAQPEGGGLAAAGFRLGADVFPGQNGGQRGGLHRRHGGKAQFVKVGELFGREGGQFSK